MEWALHPSHLGFSVLPGLACLFPSPNSGRFLYFFKRISLFFQIDFLGLSLLLLASLWCESWTSWNPHFVRIFFLLLVLIGCFLLPYVPNHWFNSQLHPFYCWFPVNCSLFQLVIFFSICFWLGIFYTAEIVTKFLEHLWASVLNSASDRLLISIVFHYIVYQFFWSFDLFFIWAMCLCVFVLADSLCLFLCIR